MDPTRVPIAGHAVPAHVLTMAREVLADDAAQQRCAVNGQLPSDCWFAKACQSDAASVVWSPQETQRCISRLGVADPWAPLKSASDAFVPSRFFPKHVETPTLR